MAAMSGVTGSTADAVTRILAGGAIGFSRTADWGPFYLKFVTESRPQDVLIEVTFNPEFVVLDPPHPTDVLVCWGDRNEVSERISALLAEFVVELCPLPQEKEADSYLFRTGADEVQVIDPESPWRFTDH
ncbi:MULTISPECIES: hypothetical protein [unclassified Microbacterium]|uniref:hypothetical protein n=1 Tax=unclassified Microbacterium TaxID=2609290 RepID=UPI00109B8FB0|nr:MULTISPECIES: hypothetical protein [unclassified Microbacterium]